MRRVVLFIACTVLLLLGIKFVTVLLILVLGRFTKIRVGEF